MGKRKTRGGMGRRDERSKGRRRRDGKEKGKENKGERRVSQHLNLWLVRSGREDRVSIRFLGGSAEKEEEVIRPRLLSPLNGHLPYWSPKGALVSSSRLG